MSTSEERIAEFERQLVTALHNNGFLSLKDDSKWIQDQEKMAQAAASKVNTSSTKWLLTCIVLIGKFQFSGVRPFLELRVPYTLAPSASRETVTDGAVVAMEYSTKRRRNAHAFRSDRLSPSVCLSLSLTDTYFRGQILSRVFFFTTMVYFPKCLFIRICLTRSTKARTANSTVFTSTRTPSFELKRCSFRSPSSYPRVSSRYFFFKSRIESSR